MRKLILRNFLSPGDIVMLTAAVQDPHCDTPEVFNRRSDLLPRVVGSTTRTLRRCASAMLRWR